MQTSDRVFYTRAFALIAVLLIGYLLYLVLAPFLAPFAWALFIAFLMHPLHRRLTQRLGGRAAASAAILTVLTFLLVIGPDRKSTRLNSSHLGISYAVFCLKKKKKR